MENEYVEYLPNGLIYVRDIQSGLWGLYNADGSYRSGDFNWWKK